jgi:hypothetical protein
MLHFLDADSRQSLDQIAEAEHLPLAYLAVKMAGGQLEEELEEGILKAFDRLLPSADAGGKTVVSIKQLLAAEPKVQSPTGTGESSSSSKPKQQTLAVRKGEGDTGKKRQQSSKTAKKNIS